MSELLQPPIKHGGGSAMVLGCCVVGQHRIWINCAVTSEVHIFEHGNDPKQTGSAIQAYQNTISHGSTSPEPGYY